ncbi:MAG: alpha/beta hydrolase-fold protein, partial [Bacilli bacterium]|nr:alpha/beta hydrolase-fold protein [Bacilli bacterium]
MMKNRVEDFEMSMDHLDHRKKRIQVFLPQDYDETESKRYPVLYMHDGQNLVEPSKYSGYSWDIVRTIDELQSKGIIDGIIIVGIDASKTKRIQEYSHYICKKMTRMLLKHFPLAECNPEGKKYSDFIVNDLKPYIDTIYRTDPLQTGTAGSSCGGNVSLYMGLYYPNVFSVIGAFSPAYWIVKKDLFPRLKEFNLPSNTKIYHDMGTKEGLFGLLNIYQYTKKVNKIFLAKGIDDNHLKMIID